LISVNERKVLSRNTYCRMELGLKVSEKFQMKSKVSQNLQNQAHIENLSILLKTNFKKIWKNWLLLKQSVKSKELSTRLKKKQLNKIMNMKKYLNKKSNWKWKKRRKLLKIFKLSKSSKLKWVLMNDRHLNESQKSHKKPKSKVSFRQILQ